MSREVLTQQQQHESEQRILHDAELIRGGAYVHHLGQLVVTDSQRIELLFTSPEPDQYSSDAHEWLDHSFEGLFGHTDDKQVSRVISTLTANGLTTFRDIMAAGRHINGIGMVGELVIEERLENKFGINWKKNPTMKDISRYCRDLSEVPSFVVHRRMSPTSVQNMVSILDQPYELFSNYVDFYVNRGEPFTVKDRQRIVEGIKHSTTRFVAEYELAREAA